MAETASARASRPARAPRPALPLAGDVYYVRLKLRPLVGVMRVEAGFDARPF